MKNNSLLLFLFVFVFGGLFSQNYELVWEENFDGTALNTDVWNYEEGVGIWNTGSNAELQYYKAANVAVGPDGQGNNALIITAKKETVGSYQFTSGRIQSRGKVEVQYGKIEARIKLPVLANGLWPAFWMLGTEKGWPASGEIDIMEAGNAQGIAAGTQERTLNGALHWEHQGNYAGYGPQWTAPAGTSLYDYNKFTLTWTPQRIEMHLNDHSTPYFSMDITSADAEEFRDWAHYFILNLAVGGSFTGITNPNNINAPLPAQMFVDYIRVYQLDGEGDVVETDSQGWDSWFGDGGAGSVAFPEEHLATITISNAGWAAYSVQLFKDGLSIPDGDYVLTFRAKADHARTINVNLGKGLNVDPWFIAYMDPASFDLTTEWQDFSLPISKENVETVGKLVFEMGDIGAGTLTTKVYLDNISFAPAGTTNLDEVDAIHVTVFPNPAESNVFVHTDPGKKVALYTLTGVQVASEVALHGEVQFNVAGLAQGIYLVEVDGKARKVVVGR
ncbi:family 16 glycosylhydrolase [Geofilum rubicundum]|uniref:Beta-1,3-glucanase II n=1 Tax=Geofilum rubicundum JCM 15548 TaxID=1236989 RepID=A0A0E9LW36_9BACT|nr:family 16 glycosylhydrolase [Geofilum rubicundum]GAO29807.1 beta-1,3-glucanase II [Geofilum rubicundum JCM 15548]